MCRLPRCQRPAVAREWLKQEEARFPDSISEVPTPLPEGTDRHPLDLILKLLPHQRPPAVRAWVEQEEPRVEEEVEHEARAAAHSDTILRFPSVWTRYPDFQQPSEPWIELLRDGRRLYHSQAGTTCLIPEEEVEPHASSPAATVSPDTEENTIRVTGTPSETAASTATEDPAPQSTAKSSPLFRCRRPISRHVIDESRTLERNLIHRANARGPTLRGPPDWPHWLSHLCASVPVHSVPSPSHHLCVEDAPQKGWLPAL